MDTTNIIHPFRQEIAINSNLGKITQALALAKSEFKPIGKSGYNPHFKSNYSTYNDISDGVDEALIKNGLTITHLAVSYNDLVGVKSILSHTSGEYFDALMLIKPSRPGPQEVGSIVTYFKRYHKAGLCGVEGEIDDDGNGASGLTEQSPQKNNTDINFINTTTQQQATSQEPPQSFPRASQGAESPKRWKSNFPRPSGDKANERISEKAAKYFWILIKQCGWDKMEAQDFMEVVFGYTDPNEFTRVDFWDFEDTIRNKDRSTVLDWLDEKKREVAAQPPSSSTANANEPPPLTDADIPF